MKNQSWKEAKPCTDNDSYSKASVCYRHKRRASTLECTDQREGVRVR